MCEHELIRATLVPEVARLIAERFGIDEDEALSLFYRSATAENLADEENGLYGQSALFIFRQYLEEVQSPPRPLARSARARRTPPPDAEGTSHFGGAAATSAAQPPLNHVTT